jgi:hypothetical protein
MPRERVPNHHIVALRQKTVANGCTPAEAAAAAAMADQLEGQLKRRTAATQRRIEAQREEYRENALPVLRELKQTLDAALASRRRYPAGGRTLFAKMRAEIELRLDFLAKHTDQSKWNHSDQCPADQPR